MPGDAWAPPSADPLLAPRKAASSPFAVDSAVNAKVALSSAAPIDLWAAEPAAVDGVVHLTNESLSMLDARVFGRKAPRGAEVAEGLEHLQARECRAPRAAPGAEG